MVKPIPDEYPGAIPYLRIRGAARAIDFYKAAFGAMETMRLDWTGGTIGHAEMKIGSATFMLSDEYPQMDIKGPESLGGTSVSIHLYVNDVDALEERARSAGATILAEAHDEFYGDRVCKIQDPFGHIWGFATHREDVSTEEMQRRARELAGEG